MRRTVDCRGVTWEFIEAPGGTFNLAGLPLPRRRLVIIRRIGGDQGRERYATVRVSRGLEDCSERELRRRVRPLTLASKALGGFASPVVGHLDPGVGLPSISENGELDGDL